MKHNALPGLGDFAVEVKGGCDYITLPRNQRMTEMLGNPWVDEMFLSLKRRLKKRGSIDKTRAADNDRVQIFKIVPAQMNIRPGKKHKSRHRPLQQDIWKAIKAFVKRYRHAVRRYIAAERRSKERLPVRRSGPATLPSRRIAVVHR